jgi:hypothetical protein
MARLLKEFVALKYDKALIKEAKENKQSIIVKALLQRADAINQNGRIYPMEVLQREVENYQKSIAEGRATGELDHPDSCFPAQYQALTRDRGWQYIGELQVNEFVATLNPVSKEIEYQPVKHKIAARYKGDLLRLRGRSFFAECTPNHRWLVNDRNHKSKFVVAEDLKNYMSHFYVPKSGTWNGGQEPEFFVLSGVGDSPDVKVDIEDWCAFFGLYLAEGHVAGSKGGSDKSHSVGISQVYNQEKVEELLLKLPFVFRKNNTGRQWICTDKRLHGYLTQFGNSFEKFIPNEIKQYSSRLLSIMFDWMMFGDGTRVESFHLIDNKRKGYIAERYASVSKKLADDVQDILLKIGKSGNIHEEIRPDREIEGRTILSENSKVMNIVHVSQTNGTYLGNGLKIDKVPFDGMVYCVSVPNEIFYVRHDVEKYPTWTGNSVVSLENISHAVREVWWDGAEVWGKLEILNTPKGRIAQDLMEAGIALGVSSRGVGEINTDDEGNDVVEENYMLICFDLVSEPSTQNAWIMKEGKELKLQEVRKLIPKVDRVNRIVNEILRTKRD